MKAVREDCKERSLGNTSVWGGKRGWVCVREKRKKRAVHYPPSLRDGLQWAGSIVRRKRKLSTLRCMRLFKLVVSFPSSIHPGLELLDHLITLFSVFQGASTLYSIVVVPVYISTNSVASLFSTPSPTVIILVVFLMTAILTRGISWHLQFSFL